jgi:hypothetical protein
MELPLWRNLTRSMNGSCLILSRVIDHANACSQSVVDAIAERLAEIGYENTSVVNGSQRSRSSPERGTTWHQGSHSGEMRLQHR